MASPSSLPPSQPFLPPKRPFSDFFAGIGPKTTPESLKPIQDCVDSVINSIQIDVFARDTEHNPVPFRGVSPDLFGAKLREEVESPKFRKKVFSDLSSLESQVEEAINKLTFTDSPSAEQIQAKDELVKLMKRINGAQRSIIDYETRGLSPADKEQEVSYIDEEASFDEIERDFKALMEGQLYCAFGIEEPLSELRGQLGALLPIVEGPLQKIAQLKELMKNIPEKTNPLTRSIDLKIRNLNNQLEDLLTSHTATPEKIADLRGQIISLREQLRDLPASLELIQNFPKETSTSVNLKVKNLDNQLKELLILLQPNIEITDGIRELIGNLAKTVEFTDLINLAVENLRGQKEALSTRYATPLKQVAELRKQIQTLSDSKISPLQAKKNLDNILNNLRARAKREIDEAYKKLEQAIEAYKKLKHTKGLDDPSLMASCLAAFDRKNDFFAKTLPPLIQIVEKTQRELDERSSQREEMAAKIAAEHPVELVLTAPMKEGTLGAPRDLTKAKKLLESEIFDLGEGVDVNKPSTKFIVDLFRSWFPTKFKDMKEEMDQFVVKFDKYFYKLIESGFNETDTMTKQFVDDPIAVKEKMRGKATQAYQEETREMDQLLQLQKTYKKEVVNFLFNRLVQPSFEKIFIDEYKKAFPDKVFEEEDYKNYLDAYIANMFKAYLGSASPERSRVNDCVSFCKDWHARKADLKENKGVASVREDFRSFIMKNVQGQPSTKVYLGREKRLEDSAGRQADLGIGEVSYYNSADEATRAEIERRIRDVAEDISSLKQVLKTLEKEGKIPKEASKIFLDLINKEDEENLEDDFPFCVLNCMEDFLDAITKMSASAPSIKVSEAAKPLTPRLETVPEMVKAIEMAKTPGELSSIIETLIQRQAIKREAAEAFLKAIPGVPSEEAFHGAVSDALHLLNLE